MDNKKLIITPKTKIAELLDTYPELEDELIEISPAFKKLKNPFLRKTVARVTSIQQAAVIGNVKVNDLLRKLKEKTGQTDEIDSAEEKEYLQEKPEWFNEDRITETIDADQILNSGENPMQKVLAAATRTDKTILKLKSSFIPSPMIDTLTSKGYKFWTIKVEEGYNTYFVK